MQQGTASGNGNWSSGPSTEEQQWHKGKQPQFFRGGEPVRQVWERALVSLQGCTKDQWDCTSSSRVEGELRPFTNVMNFCPALGQACLNSPPLKPLPLENQWTREQPWVYRLKKKKQQKTEIQIKHLINHKAIYFITILWDTYGFIFNNMLA